MSSSKRPTDKELHDLVKIAAKELERLEKEPGMDKYIGRLVAVCLCQGAALQYLGLDYQPEKSPASHGANVFGLHLFFDQHPAKKQIKRKGKSYADCKIGDFDNMNVDCFCTFIPIRRREGKIPANDAVGKIRLYLANKPTGASRKLSEKAVVGLIPKKIFGKAIWVGDWVFSYRLSTEINTNNR
jgi:hypothetical protein